MSLRTAFLRRPSSAVARLGTRQLLLLSSRDLLRGARAKEKLLVAFVAPLSGEPKRLDGVVLAEPHELVSADAAEALVTWGKGRAAPDAPPLGAAEVVREMRGAIEGVYCTP